MKEYVTIEEIYESYYECRKHKRTTIDCMEYSLEFVGNNYQLYKELNAMTYGIGPSKAFCVTRPKLREVFCAQFRDRIVHHLLVIKFGDIFEGELTPHAYACRKGMGTDYGINDVREQMERVSEHYTREAWVLKCDLQGFFMSIDRNMLCGMVERLIRERYHGGDIEWWLWLWKKVILHDPTRSCVKVGDLSLWEKLPNNKSLFTCGEGKGLPIGNLPSQILANFLLSSFDKWVLGKIGKGGGYGRYADDFVVICQDKKVLLSVLEEGRVFLKDRLRLTLHPRKISLQRVEKGVRFTGTLVRPNRTLPNMRTVEYLYGVIEEFGMIENPTREELKRYANRTNSLLGLLVHRDTYNIRRKVWAMMPHKDKVYCENMKKICLINKFK